MIIELAIQPRSRVFGCGKVQNFRLDDFLLVNRKLAEMRAYMSANRDKSIGELEAKDIIKFFSWLESTLFELQLNAVDDVEKAISILRRRPDERCSLLAHFLDEAARSIDEQIRTEWTHHYGERTSNISQAHIRWANVLKEFPTTRFEIESALDCFALEHYTASIFHFMRLAEHGLRLLAVELDVSLSKGKPLTHGNWNDIISHCDRRVKEIGASAPAGEAKDEALSFYSTSLAHLHSLKNKYRNTVMHSRKEFKEIEAVDASRITKSLMDVLATKLSERKKKKGFTPDGKIDWGFSKPI